MLVSAIHDYDKLFILTCRNFGLFLVNVTPELYFFFMIYFQNRVMSAIHALAGCGTTSKVVKKTKVIKGIKDVCSLLCYGACYVACHWKNEINENMITKCSRVFTSVYYF